MSTKKSLTLVISAYNSVRNLEFVLAALRRQSLTDFELIVGDDGSGPEVGMLVDSMRGAVQFPIVHLWQPDRGFRKTAMLNKAIEAAQTEYMVFIDHDCLPHHHFIRDHFVNREDDCVLCGRRVNFSRQITERLTVDSIREGTFERLTPRLLLDGLLARSSNLEDGIRIPSRTIRTLLHWNRARILGCNFSVEKRLLETINGFNEEYQAPGLGEDSDVAFRLGLAGARLISLRYQALLFHMYHPVTPVGTGNTQIYERVISEREMVCNNGLRKMREDQPASMTGSRHL